LLLACQNSKSHYVEETESSETGWHVRKKSSGMLGLLNDKFEVSIREIDLGEDKDGETRK
jgi:hypothetical protein